MHNVKHNICTLRIVLYTYIYINVRTVNVHTSGLGSTLASIRLSLCTSIEVIRAKPLPNLCTTEQHELRADYVRIRENPSSLSREREICSEAASHFTAHVDPSSRLIQNKMHAVAKSTSPAGMMV